MHAQYIMEHDNSVKWSKVKYGGKQVQYIIE